MKDWEKNAPICSKCKKKDNWEALIGNSRTGDQYIVCLCGNEQDINNYSL